jgi:dipeptidyl aminopeptidase/acylaminoacyl peptidase
VALDPRWKPVALTPDGRSMFVFSAEGRNTAAVFRYSIEERALKEMLAGHPTEDIGLAQERVYASDGINPAADIHYIRVVTLGMKPIVHWFDAKWAALQRSVDAALPGRVNRVSGNLSAGRMLVFSEGDVDPGTWYLLDLATMALSVVERRKPEIDRQAMLPMQVVRYRSHDGLEIPAYLTLPAGGGRDLPAVVLVHGGPLVRDRWAWNAEVQMLASRGYAVLQPQFRGSVGFGKSFEHAGYRQWGRAMQDDVSAGAEWLAAQGIADPRRICIYGASYGGYAALWALARTPALFRCGASFAGVSDLGLMFLARSDVNRTELGRLYQRRTIGDHEADAKRLAEVSPLLHAERFVAPVLLGHGDKDERVPIVHSQNMLSALQAHGKSVEWIELKGEAHGIGHPANRERFYGALFRFLEKNTAPAEAAAPADAPRPSIAVPEPTR